MEFTNILEKVAWDFMFKILEKIGNLNVFVNIICLFFQNFNMSINMNAHDFKNYKQCNV